MADPYRLTAIQAIDIAQDLNRALDDKLPPGATANSVLVLSLAQRLVEGQMNSDNLQSLTAHIAASLVNATMTAFAAKELSRKNGGYRTAK